ncbi:cytochrome b/b6 domain-containing protein [Pikeienuella sp. HZG-20]|uniref:cytochrome b/b6 domain-containing protein n=1 Tax=Paludibacillus litoralis TaxID=3133267 RepID=UPI0030EC178B
MAERQYVMIFTRFERFWHWMQALLVLALLFTGARLHGLISALDWSGAFTLHLIAAGALILLWVFAIFWHFTTGAWRHYIPTLRNLLPVIRFYAYGVFRGEAHPAKPTIHRKHNPLQRLSYLFLKLVINPAIWATGVLYLTVNLTGLDLQAVAWLHVVAAYAMAIFVVIHVYMATTGDTPIAYLKAMTTGYEWVSVKKDESGG